MFTHNIVVLILGSRFIFPQKNTDNFAYAYLKERKNNNDLAQLVPISK